MNWYVIGAIVLGAAGFIWTVDKLARTAKSTGRAEAVAEQARADTKAQATLTKKFANKATSRIDNVIKLRRWAKKLPKRNP
jgi:hypothetical protein